MHLSPYFILFLIGSKLLKILARLMNLKSYFKSFCSFVDSTLTRYFCSWPYTGFVCVWFFLFLFLPYFTRFTYIIPCSIAIIVWWNVIFQIHFKIIRLSISLPFCLLHAVELYTFCVIIWRNVWPLSDTEYLTL